MIYERHIFICTNERAEGAARPSCGEAAGMAITRAFKSELKERGLKTKVRAQRAGCLDICESGPNVVIYPEGVFYAHVKVEDVKEIIDSHIVGGEPVKRLILKEPLPKEI